MWWNRLSTAFDQFRKWSAIKTLLELAGVWKWIVLGASVMGGFLIPSFSKWDPALRVLVVMAGIALSLAIALFGVALRKVIASESLAPSREQQADRQDATRSKPKKHQIVLAVVLLLLAAIGAVWGPKKNLFNSSGSAPVPPIEKQLPAVVKTEDRPAMYQQRTGSGEKNSKLVSSKHTPSPPEPTVLPLRPKEDLPVPQVNAPGGVVSVNQQGGITAGQVNINPLPQILASQQNTRPTGDSETPWITTFTIHSTGLVSTGDLHLKCSGVVIKAGIGRINPASLITGSNGPDPNDKTIAVYELGPELLSPGKEIHVAVYSRDPITVLSGTIGGQEIRFP